jgi:predicted ABC-type ATPase
MGATLTLLAGPNGAGKSFYTSFFVDNGYISVTPINIDALEEYVDDEKLPYDTMRYGVKLKREIDRVFNKLCDIAIEKNEDFCFECNLRDDQLGCVNKFHHAGYNINLIYIWLDSIELSKERVSIRVNEGGQPVGIESIKENFIEGASNLDLSLSNGDWSRAYVIDNSRNASENGNTLMLLLEAEKDRLVRISNDFCSESRKKYLPLLCSKIRNQLNP